MTMPNNWQDADILDGLDIIDKSKLIDIPFLVTGCEFKLNNEGVSICYVDGEFLDGSGFTFTDSSTGVRAQLVAYLTAKQMDHIIDSHEYASFRLVAPAGLRVSEYDRPMRSGVAGQVRGPVPKVKTYYLTTSGRREGREQAKKQAATRRSTPATNK